MRGIAITNVSGILHNCSVRAVSIAALFCCILVGPATAQTVPVWEIGKSDRSAREFSHAGGADLTYEVGKSDWHKDWAAAQNAGSQYRIVFSIDRLAAPAGYVLHASIEKATRVFPALRVDVNGHAGTFYLHPELTVSAVEPDPVPLSHLDINVPAGYLHAGRNEITFKVLDLRNPPTAADGNLGLRWDYLSLTRAARPVQRISATVRPTIFYREHNGTLSEVVESTVRFNAAARAGTAKLTLNGRSFTAPLTSMLDFGEQLVQFEVPEWTGKAKAELSIHGESKAKFTFDVEPARKWKLFVVPHTHLDIGYTDFQGKVAEVQAQALQDSIDMIAAHPDFRFATDGSWNVEQFMDSRSPELQRKLVELVKADKIAVPASYANLLTGYASMETLYRSLYYSKALSRKLGTPFNYSSVTDVPSYTGAYPSVLAAAGIRYLAVGANQGRGPVLQQELWDEKSPFWWQGTDGKKVLFWYARGYSQIESIWGLPPEMAAGRDELPLFLTPYTRAEYKPDAVLVYGAQSENTQIQPALAGFASEWNHEYVYPKLQYSTFVDFFHYIDERYGAALPTYKGDFGPYWEDGVAADAANTAQDRANQQRAASVDIASTAARELGRGYHAPKSEMDDAWRNIVLYSEHTWTGGMSVTQPHMDRVIGELAVKDNRATQAKFELEDVSERSLGLLADQIRVPAKTLVVFNGLNWNRDVLIETDLRKHESLVDLTTGSALPVEVLWRKEGFTRARVLIPDVPGVGYKCVQFKDDNETDVPMNARTSADTEIENRFYRFTVDAESGAIRSIYDKQLERELVDQKSPYRFGQYVYVTGGDTLSTIIHSDPGLPRAELAVHTAQRGKYLGTTKTPWGRVIRLESSSVNTPSIQTEILLFDGAKKMEFNYTVDKKFTYSKEGVYIAFPAAVTKPEFAFELQQGWADPAKDLLKGGSAEWFTVQHWMAVHDDKFVMSIVPVDAPMAAFGDIVRGDWPGEFHPKSGTIFSYVMNNYWDTNYQAGQEGVFKFRYVLTSTDEFDPAVFTKLGWEAMQPVELNRVIVPDKIGNPDRPLPAEGAKFVEVTGANVVLSEWKPAEDGKGTIMRVAETGGKHVRAGIRLPRFEVRSAALCNAVEDDCKGLDVKSNSIEVDLDPWEVVTVRVVTDKDQ